MFAYSLGNSEVGVYNGSMKKWGIKSGSRVTALCGTNYSLDGEQMIITGSANGLLEVRNTQGDLIDQHNLSSSISEVLYTDFRSQGTEQVVVTFEDGQVRGYNLTTEEQAQVVEANTTVQKEKTEAITQEIAQLQQKME